MINGISYLVRTSTSYAAFELARNIEFMLNQMIKATSNPTLGDVLMDLSLLGYRRECKFHLRNKMTEIFYHLT